jgi:hypothetical protein
MAWMRMPEQTWLGAAATFLGMWAVMMVAMMLPSLAPMLNRYRRSVAAASEGSLARLTAIAGAGYCFRMGPARAVVYPHRSSRCAAMHARACGARSRRAVRHRSGRAARGSAPVQLVEVAAPRIAAAEVPRAVMSCRPTPDRHGSTACTWGLQCCACCVGLTAILLVSV